MAQHLVDVDRFTRDRSLVGEHIHVVDEGGDAVGLVTD